MRVINDKVKVTKDLNEFTSQYDEKFNVLMNIQAAGGGYYVGSAAESKGKLTGLRNEMLSEMERLKSLKMSFNEQDFSEGLAYLDDELEEIEMEEEKVAQAPAKSYWAVKGQQRARTSLNSLKKRIEKKKK
jgi:hypothetical protein